MLPPPPPPAAATAPAASLLPPPPPLQPVVGRGGRGGTSAAATASAGTWARRRGDLQAPFNPPPPPPPPSTPPSPSGLAVGTQRYRALRALVAQWNAGTASPPAGVDVTRVESLLTHDDLTRVLEVDSPAAFAALPKWHQMSLRKKAHLWVRPPTVAVPIAAGGK
jgi:hypothetical protein